MTKLIFITLFPLLFSCRNNNSRQRFTSIDKTHINQIVEAVIFQDSLRFLKTDSLMPIPLSLNLRKLRVTVPDTTSDVPPQIDHNTVSIFNLFNSLVNDQRFFGRADSSYFLFQNNSIDSFVLYRKIAEKVFSTTINEQQQKDEPMRNVSYYDLTIPILSADQSKAYVELTNNCSGCGGATALYLKKTSGTWTIVGWQRLWMN